MWQIEGQKFSILKDLQIEFLINRLFDPQQCVTVVGLIEALCLVIQECRI